MKGDLKFFRVRWRGFYLLFPLCLLFALPIALISIDNFHAGNLVGALVGGVIAAVCLLCCIVLYAPYSCFYAIKLIGGVVFLGYVAYALDCLQAGKIYASSRAEPAFINAILGLFYWGVPGLLLFLKAQKPAQSPYSADGKLLFDEPETKTES